MTRGPQQPSLEKEAVKPKIERASGIVKSSVGDKTAGELRWRAYLIPPGKPASGSMTPGYGYTVNCGFGPA